MWLPVVAVLAGLALVLWSIQREQDASARRAATPVHPSVVPAAVPKKPGNDWGPIIWKIIIAVLVAIGIAIFAYLLSPTDSERDRRRRRRLYR